MAIYLVNQGKTYRYERAGGYIWSPKLNKAGNQNRGYSLMKSVKKGDFIIHNSGGRLSAISVVKEDCKSGGQPHELKVGQNEYDWDDDGWVVNTKYYDFDVPLLTADLVEWAIANYKDDSAFQVKGLHIAGSVLNSFPKVIHDIIRRFIRSAERILDLFCPSNL